MTWLPEQHEEQLQLYRIEKHPHTRVKMRILQHKPRSLGTHASQVAVPTVVQASKDKRGSQIRLLILVTALQVLPKYD